MSILSNLIETVGKEAVEKLAKTYITKENLVKGLKYLADELDKLSEKSETKLDDAITDQLKEVISQLQ